MHLAIMRRLYIVMNLEVYTTHMHKTLAPNTSGHNEEVEAL